MYVYSSRRQNIAKKSQDKQTDRHTLGTMMIIFKKLFIYFLVIFIFTTTSIPTNAGAVLEHVSARTVTESVRLTTVRQRSGVEHSGA